MKQAAGTDTVGAALIFLDLLEGKTKGLAELFLGHAQKRAALTQAQTHMHIDRMRTIILLLYGGRWRPDEARTSIVWIKSHCFRCSLVTILFAHTLSSVTYHDMPKRRDQSKI